MHFSCVFSIKESPAGFIQNCQCKKPSSEKLAGTDAWIKKRERDKQREIRERGREIDERIEFGFQHEVSHLSVPKVTPA